MRMIAALAKQVWQGAVRGTSNSPRLLDWRAGVAPTSGDEAVHASIEVGEDEAVRRKELDYAVVLPIRTLAWPLHEYARADGQSVDSHNFECGP